MRLSATDLDMKPSWGYVQVRMLKEALPHMRAARKGQVIVVTSLVGFKGFAFTDAYTASKFALEGVFASQEAPHSCQGSQTWLFTRPSVLHH